MRIHENLAARVLSAYYSETGLRIPGYLGDNLVSIVKDLSQNILFQEQKALQTFIPTAVLGSS